MSSLHRKLILALIFLFFVISSAEATITEVQTKIVDQATNTTQTLVPTSNLTAGNLYVFFFRTSSGITISSVTSALGNTYTLIRHDTLASGLEVYGYYAKNISAGAETITVNLSATSSFRADGREVSGLQTSCPLDQSAGQSQTSATAADSGSVTTTYASEYLYGFNAQNVGGHSYTVGTGWSSLNTMASNKAAAESQIVSSTGTYDATFTISAADGIVTSIATFKAAAASCGGKTTHRVIVP